MDIEKTLKYYNKHACNFYTNTINIDMRQIYIPFITLMHKGGKILDAGCGSGRDSLFFEKQGFKVTAFDASEKLSSLASKLLQKPVHCLSFEQISFKEKFDGIWACSSLIHISKSKMNSIISKLEQVLKKNGIFYMSFKHGNKERFARGRFFNDYNEISFLELMEGFSSFDVVKIWKSVDLRQCKKNQFWLNVIVKKK
ncbi:MAG: class I SAM-dependent methyltransferase [Candidatus Saelkia tenebricola]|nr:class I SAM-dependent methyltransferase [Candidatus Saelkia tenebricola]